MEIGERWEGGESRQSDRRRQIEALRRVLTEVNNSWRSKQAQLTSPVWRRPRGAGNGSPGGKNASRTLWERKACFDQCHALSASGYTIIQSAAAAERRAC